MGYTPIDEIPEVRCRPFSIWHFSWCSNLKDPKDTARDLPAGGDKALGMAASPVASAGADDTREC